MNVQIILSARCYLKKRRRRHSGGWVNSFHAECCLAGMSAVRGSSSLVVLDALGTVLALNSASVLFGGRQLLRAASERAGMHAQSQAPRWSQEGASSATIFIVDWGLNRHAASHCSPAPAPGLFQSSISLFHVPRGPALQLRQSAYATR